ncbi:hypothetical protein AB5I41_22755 [Sphingomonas sp. MMS24-JH45]
MIDESGVYRPGADPRIDRAIGARERLAVSCGRERRRRARSPPPRARWRRRWSPTVHSRAGRRR